MIFLTFYNFWCGFHCCAHENEVYFMYVFLSTLGSPEIGFLNNFYCVLSSIHEYFCEVLRTYLSTFIKWVISTYSSTFQATSTQYLLEYWSSVLTPCLPGAIYTCIKLWRKLYQQCSRYFFFPISIMLVKFEASQYQTKVGHWNQYPPCWLPDSDIIIILCPLSANRSRNSMLIFHNNWCVICLWLIYGSEIGKFWVWPLN